MSQQVSQTRRRQSPVPASLEASLDGQAVRADVVERVRAFLAGGGTYQDDDLVGALAAAMTPTRGARPSAKR